MLLLLHVSVHTQHLGTVGVALRIFDTFFSWFCEQYAQTGQEEASAVLSGCCHVFERQFLMSSLSTFFELGLPITELQGL
jgi:hypothetical protein